MEKKSIFDNFRRPSGQKSKADLMNKKQKSDEAKEDPSDRRIWPIEEKLQDPIRRVTPFAPPRQRASEDNVTRGCGHSDTMYFTMRSSPSAPLGPRDLPRENNGERAPYEPKYFPRIDSLGSLHSSPTKAASSSIQGARSMSQASNRGCNTTNANASNIRTVPAVRSFEYPQRMDLIAPPLRRGQSNMEDELILNLRLSEAYDIRKAARHRPAVPLKNSVRGPDSSHGERSEVSSSLGRYPSTPRKPRQRSKLDQATSVDNGNNASEQAPTGGISRWGTYSAQSSPKLPLTPGRSTSNGAEMQQWLQQNATVLKKFGSPERTRLRGQYDNLSPRHTNEAEAFQKSKEASHRRKVSIEAIRKAQEAMIIYPQNKKYVSRNNKRSPATQRKTSATYGSLREKNVSPVAQKPEIQYPPGEMPNPFLSPEEKLKMAGYEPSTARKPVCGNFALQYADNEQILQPLTYQIEKSPSHNSKGPGRSRIPTPSKAIRRKTVKGPSMSDLAAKRAFEYEHLAGNTFENGHVSVETKPSLGLSRSYQEQNIAIRAIATPTYEEVDNEPFEFSELVPRPLSIAKKRQSKESTIRTVLGRKPTLRTSKTQGPGSSSSNRSYWNYGSRTKLDDFETLKERETAGDTMKIMHDQIDDYLDILLAKRVEAKLAAQEEIECDHETRVASRSTMERHHYFSGHSDYDDHELYRARMAAEKNRRQELSVEEAQSSPKLGQDEVQTIKLLRAIGGTEELSRGRKEVLAAKGNDKWAEMRAKLRVDSTYSDLSMLARSPHLLGREGGCNTTGGSSYCSKVEDGRWTGQ